MPKIGRRASQKRRESTPLFLIDNNLSYKLAQALRDVGFDCTSVKAEFPDLENASDEGDIIPWLSTEAGYNGVWVTADEEAQRVHAKIILAKIISVLWIQRPKRGLSALQELQLLSYVILPVNTIVASATQPVYFKASFNAMRPKLEQMTSSLYDKKLQWKRIPHPQ